MRRSRKQTVKPGVPLGTIPTKSLELETAKEILAEVFRVKLSEVDDMILSRFEAVGNEDIGSEELWPQEFSLGE